MNRLGSALALVLSLSILCSCTNKESPSEAKPTASLLPMSPSQALADFREMTHLMRTLYGPLEYKEQRFGFSFDEWATEIERELMSAKSDAEIFGAYTKFLARFHDGHIGIYFPMNSTLNNSYSVPIFVTPVRDSFLVANVGEELKATQLSVGDEILRVDGQTPEELLKIVLRHNAFATPESNRHWAFKIFHRDFFMPELTPTKDTVQVVYRKPDGRVLTEDFVWSIARTNSNLFVKDVKGFVVPAAAEINLAAGNSIMRMAAPTPFFATKEVLQKYGFRIVTANEEYRKKYGLSETDKPNIFAALYKFQGKTILLVRNYVYFHSDHSNVTYLKAYKAILDQWADFADVLVVDQTHNGGGAYCEEFYRLFISSEQNGFVQKLNVDRKWMVALRDTWASFISQANGLPENKMGFAAMGSVVEAAYDRGEKMTEPLPIIGGVKRVTPTDYSWKKPMLVLIDELAGSCGDAFPMLVKNNGTAKLFGRRTMGLGGNVEGFTLSQSQASIRFTRGLFTSYREDGNYQTGDWIENNGVEPDYPYEHTVEDFRKGFVDYVEAFSEKALEQIQ